MCLAKKRILKFLHVVVNPEKAEWLTSHQDECRWVQSLGNDAGSCSYMLRDIHETKNEHLSPCMEKCCFIAPFPFTLVKNWLKKMCLTRSENIPTWGDNFTAIILNRWKEAVPFHCQGGAKSLSGHPLVFSPSLDFSGHSQSFEEWNEHLENLSGIKDFISPKKLCLVIWSTVDFWMTSFLTYLLSWEKTGWRPQN